MSVILSLILVALALGYAVGLWLGCSCGCISKWREGAETLRGEGRRQEPPSEEKEK